MAYQPGKPLIDPSFGTTSLGSAANYVGSPLTPPSVTTASPLGKQNAYSAATDKQIMDRLGSIFGRKPIVSYWALLTFVVVWFIFAIVILVIFISASKAGWGFYYMLQILFLGLFLGIVVWVLCAQGYSTVAWVITGISIAVAIGLIVWAGIAFPQIKNLSRSPFG